MSAQVGDKVPKPAWTKAELFASRPRVITVASVTERLNEVGCVCCGATWLSNNLKHRAGCLYMAYVRADALGARVETLELALSDVRRVASSAILPRRK